MHRDDVILFAERKDHRPSAKDHHDDFEYSVQSVQKVPQVGSLHADGNFYIVVFQVENRAKRIDHRWTNNIAYVVDEAGTHYENDAQAQQELHRITPFGYRGEYVTPAGTTETILFIFDVPVGVTEAYLQVRGSLLMGDLFDGNQYRKTKVKLF